MARAGFPSLVSFGLSCVAFIAMTAHPALAETRALIVGVNDYSGPPKLRGAVNDARDVAASLGASGVSDVTVLVDQDATREKTFAAWEAMNSRSAAGDLLIFHFAGHGISIPDDSGDEADKQDESYLFVGFDEEAHPDEQLVDDELDQWLAQAGNAGRRVLFIADACHSGSPTRAVFGETLPTRFYRPRTEPERPRPLVEASATGAAETESRDYVFSVGATVDSRTIPEMMIDDAPRGALSYAVARAIEGEADLDGDGHVVASEFETFVKQNVRSIAASKQTPQFEIPDEGLRIIEVVADNTPPKPTTDNSIRIHIRPGGDPSLTDAVAGLEGISIVDDEAVAQLVFDPATGSLANNVRDLIAENLDAQGLLTAIEADRALRKLQELGMKGTLPIAFSPDDGVHAEGTKIEFTIAGVGGKFLTMFDLTATGSVHFLYPTAGDADPIADSSLSLPTRVTPPFGADNLVVLATPTAPSSLRDTLLKLDGTKDPGALVKSIEEAVAGQDYEIGIQAFFTRQQ